MDTIEIRRARLKQWFENRSLPEKEKSYLSQLMTGKASFGERAARRLETDYGMGTGYLDVPFEEHAQTVESFLSGPGIGYIDATQTAELIKLFGQSTLAGRDYILRAARNAPKLTGSGRGGGKIVDDKTN